MFFSAFFLGPSTIAAAYPVVAAIFFRDCGILVHISCHLVSQGEQHVVPEDD